MKDITLSLCMLVGLCIRDVMSYSTGAPTRACGDMTPQHGFPINTAAAPYLVEVSKTQYRPNERIYVRIRACGNKRFKGFMIQPRSAMFPNRPAFLGAFLRVRGSRYECVRSGGVLTHSSPVEKQSMTLTWIAPPGAAGHVVFRVTFVESYTSYWVGINSPVVYDGVSPDLSLMQAFGLQSSTDRTCMPAEEVNTTTSRPTTTPAAPVTTTRTTTTRLPTTTEFYTMPPETTTEYYFPTTTTTLPTTTTTRATTTTTTRRPTTTRRTTTTTTTTPAPTTTTTIEPTTTRARATTEEYYYYWDTTTMAAIPTQPPTTTTDMPTTTTRTTTTTMQPTTTTTMQPTTTTAYVPPPTTQPVTTTTIEPTTTTTMAFETTTTTAYPTTTTDVPTTTTTALPSPPPTTTTTREPTTTMRHYTTGRQTTFPTIDFFNPTTTTTMAPTTTADPVTTTFPLPTTTRAVLPQQTSTVSTPRFDVRTSKTFMPTTGNNMPTRATNTDTTSSGTTDRTTNIYRPTQTMDYFRNSDTAYFPSYFDERSTQGSGAYPTTVRQVYEGTSQQPYVPTTFLPYYPSTGYPLYPSTGLSFNPSTSNATRRNSDAGMTFPPEMYPMYPWDTTTTGPRADPTTAAAPQTTTTAKTNKPVVFREVNITANATTQINDIPTTTTDIFYTATLLDETTPKQERFLTPDLACGSTQGCFDDCKNGRCNFIISWKPDKDLTHFEIRTKPRIAGPYWAAVGFSDDKMMGLDSVTECITDGQTFNFYQSYNLDYYRNMRLLTPQLGLMSGAGSYDDGLFRCSFTRKNYVAGEKDVFDLERDWHMMFAEGPSVNDIKIPHRYDRVPPVSRDRMDLQRYPPIHETYDYSLAHTENIRVINVTAPPIPTTKQRRIAMDTECGAKKSCFQDCTTSGCNFIVSWVPARDHVAFSIKAVLNETRNQWVAIAFSDDKLMGNDSVVQCVADEENRISILHSYNSGHNNIIVDNAQSGIHNASASFTDGIFECSFERDRLVVENEQIFDLDQPWSIHFAHGRSKKGIMLPHNLAEKPHVSDDLVDFSRSAVSLLSANDMFIKIHASLMIFAWILCAAISSVVGRYFQPYYWGEKLLGSKTWIKVHWLFVLLTCAAVISAFAVIFVGVDGISELYQHPEAGFNGTHPIMGLVVTLLSLLNPLLLCLRPSEDSQSRAFFNCLYWLVEIGAHVLAVVTIYAGFGLASHLVPSFFTFLIIGFTVYQILILLFMEALKSFDAKKTIEKKKLYLYEMQIRPWNQRKNTMAAYIDLNHTSKGLKQMVLAAHLILLSALTTTMVVLIVIQDL